VSTEIASVFEFSPEAQLQLQELVAEFMQLGTGSLVASEATDAIRQLQGLATFAPVKIPGADEGVILDGGIIVPLGAGPHPVVILPAPLAPTGWMSYPGMLIQLGLRGYIALAYSERGLGNTEGLADVAGPRDRADGSAVIDWVLANYPQADPTRIGFAGSSFGAGQSLLIAAHDPRVKAVCAQSAWADLFLSLYENETPHIQAVDQLAMLFQDRFTEEARRILTDFKNNNITDEVRAFCRERSPMTYLADLSTREIPIFLGTYWHETVFSVPAVVEFFNGLTHPKKRLLVQIGDHGGGEAVGFLGGFSRPTAMTYKWLDRFVKGTEPDASDDLALSVHAESMPMNLLEKPQQVSSWGSYVQPAVRYYLNAPDSGSQDGTLSPEPVRGGAQEFVVSEVSTSAFVAPVMIKTGMMERLGKPHLYPTFEISRGHAAVWSTQPFTTARRIIGSPTLHLVVTSSTPSVTLMAYLFDLDLQTNINMARIITSAPFTVHHQGPEQTTTIAIPLQPADYRVPAGHQLQLIVDAKDRFFLDASIPGTKVTVSTVNGGSYLAIPIKGA